MPEIRWPWNNISFGGTLKLGSINRPHGSGLKEDAKNTWTNYVCTRNQYEVLKVIALGTDASSKMVTRARSSSKTTEES